MTAPRGPAPLAPLLPWLLMTESELCSAPAGHEYQRHFTITIGITGEPGGPALYRLRNRGRVMTPDGEWT